MGWYYGYKTWVISITRANDFNLFWVSVYVLESLEYLLYIFCRESLEDPLEDQGLISQQLDQLSTIGRCEYEKTCALLVQLFDESAQQYQQLLSSGQQSNIQVAVQEGE